MIWPNEFAAWLVAILGVTDENMIGGTVMAAVMVYFVVVVVIPAGIGAWIINKTMGGES